MKEFHRRDFANRTGLAQAWTVKSADRLFTVPPQGAPTRWKPKGTKRHTTMVFAWVGWGLGCLLLCCFCCLVGVDFVILYLPKEACQGGDVSDDSWLKWHEALLTVLRHSRILADAIELDRQYPHPAPAQWQSRERSMLKAWFGCPRFHCMMEDM